MYAITGATGFIGQRLVTRLRAEGVAVRALLLPAEAAPAAWGDGVEVVRGDVRDRAAVEATVAGAQVVFHLAAMVGDWGDEALFDAVAVVGTQRVMEAAPAGARVVHVSSIVYYGDAIGRDVCDETHPPGRALGMYSRAKQAQERVAREIADRRGLALVIVRPANVYGAGCRPWVDDLIAEVRRGTPSLIAGGRTSAALCHVDNLVDALWLAARRDAAIGRAYNIHDDGPVTWATYCGDLARLAGAPAPRSLPRTAARAIAWAGERLWTLTGRRGRPPLTFEALNLLASRYQIPVTRARAELGWSPRVGYAEGLAEIARYLGRA